MVPIDSNAALIQIYEQIKPHIINNEIRQADGDSGDSAIRSAQFLAITTMINASPVERALATNFTYSMALKSHEVEPGYYRRTNNAAHWGYDGHNFSRDQFSNLQLLFAVYKDKTRLKDSFWALVKRFGFHQNYKRGTDCEGLSCYKIPDVAHPVNLSLVIRGLDLWTLKPILYITDLFFLGDLYFRTKTPHDYDQLLMPQLAFANLRMPTFISKLAWHFYDKEDALEKIEKYHAVGPEQNGILGFSGLFRLLVGHVEDLKNE